MSMHPYHYLMLGAPIERDSFPGDPWDDEWLPYYEGHEGVEMSIIYGESPAIYAGKIYGSPISDDRESGHQDIETPTAEDAARVREFLRQLGCETLPKLMIVTVWM